MSSPLRLLLIEDDPSDVELLLHTLRSTSLWDLKYEHVDTPEALLDALRRQEWDIVTTDNAMPAFDARSVLNTVRGLRPALPLIVVSGDIDIALAVSLLKAGAQDYVPKRELSRLPEVIDFSLREGAARRESADTLTLLKTSEARYRRLFETAQDGILIMDPLSEGIVDVNPFLIEMLGYAKDEFIGKKLWELGLFKDIEACKILFNELQTKGYVRYDDLPLVTRDGRRKHVEFVCNTYPVGAEKVIQCNIRDITQRQQAEQELRDLNSVLEERVRVRTAELEGLNQELAAFSFSVAHDLRAPLRHIDGFAGILEREITEPASSRTLPIVRNIRSSVERMSALIEALLRLANYSISALNREAVNLSALVQLAANELQQSDPQRRVEWDIQRGVNARADNQLLRIVLDNLVGNAWKFTGRRETAHIEFGEATQADGNQAYFIRDDGAGFDMTFAGKLFGAFQRLHRHTDFPGLGIGLATVQRIVHRHGGRVWAESVLDQGSTFWFTLPDDETGADTTSRGRVLSLPAENTAAASRPYHALLHSNKQVH